MCYFTQIKDEEIDFFPLFHALALEEVEDGTAKQLDELRNMVKGVIKRFEDDVSNCCYTTKKLYYIKVKK